MQNCTWLGREARQALIFGWCLSLTWHSIAFCSTSLWWSVNCKALCQGAWISQNGEELLLKEKLSIKAGFIILSSSDAALLNQPRWNLKKLCHQVMAFEFNACYAIVTSLSEWLKLWLKFRSWPQLNKMLSQASNFYALSWFLCFDLCHGLDKSQVFGWNA